MNVVHGQLKTLTILHRCVVWSDSTVGCCIKYFLHAAARVKSYVDNAGSHLNSDLLQVPLSRLYHQCI